MSNGSESKKDGPAYSGGDGRTPETAVVIEDVSSHVGGIQAEKAYISRQLEESQLEWDLLEQALLEREDGTRIDRLTVEQSTGKTETFYFDVSNFFGMDA